MNAYCSDWRWLISDSAHLHCSGNCWIISWYCWTTRDFWKSSLFQSPVPWGQLISVYKRQIGLKGVVQLLLLLLLVLLLLLLLLLWTVVLLLLLLLLQTLVMSGTKLTQLFLFNPSWGPREGQEEEKVVLHWPDHLDADANTDKKNPWNKPTNKPN